MRVDHNNLNIDNIYVDIYFNSYSNINVDILLDINVNFDLDQAWMPIVQVQLVWAVRPRTV
jgi:hypothetical protein